MKASKPLHLVEEESVREQADQVEGGDVVDNTEVQEMKQTHALSNASPKKEKKVQM